MILVYKKFTNVPMANVPVTDVPIPDPSIADGRIPDENAGQSQPSRSGSRQVEFEMGATPNRFLEAHRSKLPHLLSTISI